MMTCGYQEGFGVPSRPARPAARAARSCRRHPASWRTRSASRTSGPSCGSSPRARARDCTAIHVEETHLLLHQLDGEAQVTICSGSAGEKFRQAAPDPFDDTQSCYEPWGDGAVVDEPSALWTAVLRAGEAVTVPRGCWHAVLTLRPSLLLVRHVVNRSNSGAFAARQRSVALARAAFLAPSEARVCQFAAARAALAAPAEAPERCAEPRLCDGDGCAAHATLLGEDGAGIFSTRLPDGAPPRFFRLGAKSQPWTSALVCAALAAAPRGPGRTRVALAPAAVSAAAPGAPLQPGAALLAEVEVVAVLSQERASGAAAPAQWAPPPPRRSPPAACQSRPPPARGGMPAAPAAHSGHLSSARGAVRLATAPAAASARPGGSTGSAAAGCLRRPAWPAR
ncbi:unnamed protein product [Prorocentrum cordatum]|uniref:JmjC domain-containing protein n=1 Tax=Prorocentrum cordatum TaxID=2364126 RepID=A0ABN9TM26_9DINO|nr:unnamed protein product [Polarella glacialis]